MESNIYTASEEIFKKGSQDQIEKEGATTLKILLLGSQ
jgi:hypothetical protein